MKTLLLMRHAKSSWNRPELSDHDRPLNDRGQRDAPRMGRLIKDKKILPDQLICSDALRTKTTAALLREASGYAEKVIEEPLLYNSSEENYFHVIQKTSDAINTLMVIGHNTTLEDLIYTLTKTEEIIFPTAALAHLELSIESWKSFSPHTPTKLIKIYKPKELPNDY